MFHRLFARLIILLTLLTSFPSEGIVCYKCDSIALEACAMSLDESELPYEECKSSLQCVMSIVDAVTYRGCSANTPTNGATYKKSCGENLCNKGVYPPGRLKCYHCNGPECVPAPEGKPHPCREHHEQGECYTEVLSTRSGYRGCRSDTNHTVAGVVQYCDINGCNNAAGATKLSCAQCDSRDVRGCKMNLFDISNSSCVIEQYDVCEVDILLLQPETCFVYHNLQHVVRGCTKYMPEELLQDAQLAQHLTECNDSQLCNRQCLAQQNCLVCDSSVQSSCRSDPTAVLTTTCGSAEDSACYASEYQNWQVRRGCGATPQTSDVNRYYECADTARCNDGNFTRCYNCSSESNVNCANWERPGFGIEIEECAHPNASCVTAVFPAEGVTLRGCESDYLHCNASLNSCSACVGSFCNTGAFPPQRLRCYQCTESEISDCANVQNADALPCLPVDLEPLGEHEACFEYYDLQAGGMVRGCRSDFDRYFACLRQQNSNAGDCRICRANGCNNSPARQAAALACYACDRSSQNCELDQSEFGQLVPCEAPVPFGYEESCYLTRHIDGTVSRGCTLDREIESNDSEWDQTVECDYVGCNFVATTTQYCIDCETDLNTNAACFIGSQLLKPTVCQRSGYAGCYVFWTDAVLRRGCSNELTSAQLEICDSPTPTNCTLCRGQRCNSHLNFQIGPAIVFKSSSKTFLNRKFLLVFFIFEMFCKFLL